MCLVGSNVLLQFIMCSEKLVVPVASRNPYSCMTPRKAALERRALLVPHLSLVR